ncbi:MAG: valine--tRNA ligase [Candidatus Omnitrophota bacterium]
MEEELPKQYNPKETEDKWYKFWQDNNLLSANPNSKKDPFCIVIPPPNVTGILHMGHALNNTIQDILIRYQRMKGKESLWMPGTDHAGIATQNVVEKTIAKEGLKRQDLGREAFIERVWKWKEQYGSTIIRQLKKLGASCDWSRERFTMDLEYSKAVTEVFVSLYEKGLIYQGSYIINWCPRCQTALSDEEAPHHELNGSLYYLRYPLKVGTGRDLSELKNYIVVATTRPETMLGDTAVAVNPKDKRYKKLIGKTLILPLINREIKIIADPMVDMEFGTGAVKVTPAHDPNDYAMGKKHNLEFINVLSPDARMNESAGDYKDMDRFEAREVIIEDLKEKGLLEKIQPHKLSAGHCYRCHSIIEPYLSKQWFVKMKPLAKPAIEAVKKGKIKFHPKRWEKVYLNWMDNIQDWCISRQIWWGHRLPVYHCQNCLKQANESIVDSPQSIDKTKSMDHGPWTMDSKGIIVSRIKPEKCPVCGSTEIIQEEDVLDTWFSSWLWPFAVFYWPFEMMDEGRRTKGEKDLKYFYPTSVLVTAPEIIFFWVARMIMAGLEFMKEIPFKDVYIHGTVRDIEGKKMSKSLGNIIDPLEIIEEYGTDALRFSLISITSQGQDVYLTKERFEQGRNFANKIWNASRFIMMNSDLTKLSLRGSEANEAILKAGLLRLFEARNDNSLDIINRWILSRFYSVLKDVHKALDKFQFNEAANSLYSFFWHEFCDWYLELTKPILTGGNQNPVGTGHDLSVTSKKHETEIISYTVLEQFLRILHPFMPFVTEEIWQKLPHEGNSIMVQNLPLVQEKFINKGVEQKMDQVFQVITTIRNMRQELDIPVTQDINVVISTKDKDNRQLLEFMSADINNLARVKELNIKEKYTHIKSSVTTVLKDMHITIPLEGILDIEKEKTKIESRIESTNKEIKAKEKTLSNKNFVERAPSEVVEKERQKLKDLKDILKRLESIKDGL